MYYVNSDLEKPHLVFIGRWCPLHKGHIHIIESKIKEKKLPALILIRDTNFDIIDAYTRAEIIAKWIESENISASIMIIPDIEGIYYSRGVGYNVEEILVPDNIKAISATEIRSKIKSKDESWKELVHVSAVKLIESALNDRYFNTNTQ